MSKQTEQQTNNQVAELDVEDKLDTIAHNHRFTTALGLGAGALVALGFAAVGFAAARRQANS